MDINKLLIPTTNNLVNYHFWRAKLFSKSGKYIISIVASNESRCQPQCTMDYPEYEAFEICIFDATDDCFRVTSKLNDQLFPIFNRECTTDYEVFGNATQEQIWACVNAL